MKKPSKDFDYKSVNSCMKKYAFFTYNVPYGMFPCRDCLGRGFRYDPDESPDPVEGYKLVSRLKCKTCDGKKFTCSAEDLLAFNSFIDSSKKRYIQKVQDYRRHRKVLRNALSKLNDDEIKVLKKEFSGMY